MEQKHILILPSWYPNEKEPFLGNFIEQYANAMSKRHRVTVLYLDFSSKDKYGMVEENHNENFKVCRAHIPSKKGVFYKYVAHKMGIDWLEKNHPKVDIIHAQVGVRDWWHFLRVRKRLMKPLVYTEHGSFFTKQKFDKLSFFKKRGLRRLFKFTYANTAVSSSLASYMQEVSDKKVEVIGNFIPNEWFNLSVNQKSVEIYRFLHISTLDDNKNPKGILQACKSLVDKGISNWSLTIVSEENSDDLKTWSIDNGLMKYVSFEKHVSHSDIPQVYADHDCFVLNSNRETFSIVNAEALCLGLHLITTPVGFLEEDKTDYIDKVKFDSPSDLSFKMEIAIKEKKTSGMKGRVFIEQFREDSILNKYEALYSNILGE